MTSGQVDLAATVPHPARVSVYIALLKVPEVPRLLLGALLGRAQLGMAPLAILLVVQSQTGSFSDAGVAVGVFGATGATATPVLGRLVDRVGQVPVLAVSGAVQSLGFIVLAVGARHGASYGELVAVAAVAGAALPPLSSCMRALWPILVSEPSHRESAYTLDAISQELIWTIGPLVVAASVAVASPSVALIVCATLTAAGVAIFSLSPTPRVVRRSHRHPSRIGALSSARIRALLVCIGLASVGTGICQVAIPAIGVHAGSAEAAGVLLGLWSVGSMVGAIAFGAVRWLAPVTSRYSALFALLAVATLPLIWSRSIPISILFALVAGLPLAALIGCQYILVSEAAPTGTVTEAFAWNSAAAFGAISGGSALGGWTIKQYGLGTAFAIAAVMAALAAAAALASMRR